MKAKTLGLTMIASAALAGSAFAHTGHEHVDGFVAGLAHPLTGLDHLAAMVAVGWAAAGLAARRVWAPPAVFVATMALAAAVAFGAGATAWAEWGILASLVALGALLAFGARAGILAALALTCLAAIPHGVAHGAELPRGADALRYLAGFTLSTAALHGGGLAFGLGVARLLGDRAAWVRWAGALGLSLLAVAGAM